MFSFFTGRPYDDEDGEEEEEDDVPATPLRKKDLNLGNLLLI